MNDYDDKDNIIDINPVKIVLLGESGVGKTNIIRRYGGDTFDEKLEPTSKVYFCSRAFSINKKLISFYLWDTPGKEKLTRYIKFFLNEADALLLVYDITNKKSFNELKNYWIKEIKKSNLIPKCK